MAKQKPAVYTTDQQWFEAIYDEIIALRKELAGRGSGGSTEPAGEGVTCTGCGRPFKSDQALQVHRRTCKGKGA